MQVSSTQSQQVQTILDTLKAQLEQDGLQDVAGAIIPQLETIQRAPNVGVAVMQGGLILGQLVATLPMLETQALQQISAAVIAIIRVYVPAQPA